MCDLGRIFLWPVGILVGLYVLSFRVMRCGGSVCTACEDSSDSPCSAGPIPQTVPKACYQGYCDVRIYLKDTGGYMQLKRSNPLPDNQMPFRSDLIRGCPNVGEKVRTTDRPPNGTMDCYFIGLPYECVCSYDGCNNMLYNQVMKLKRFHDNDQQAMTYTQWRMNKEDVDYLIALPDGPVPPSLPSRTESTPALTFPPETYPGATEKEGGAAAQGRAVNATTTPIPAQKETGGLSTTTIAIIVGLVLVIALIILFMVWRMTRNKKKKKRKSDDEDEEDEDIA
ncbi:uncharacterized protein LOC129600902 isoform X2 [Paramacrobiotus metropolitanus]|uniref:uncharacterized protein LOC129600902 isoform X2 n=1 Tax=Paramacrobiotus metropolitanus TaxID=2943436 RepID=UPI002445F4B2|nr:uncharacterized protein LOC129600902 isoform X2 [Paramacrobiotus metropolitanus]